MIEHAEIYDDGFDGTQADYDAEYNYDPETGEVYGAHRYLGG